MEIHSICVKEYHVSELHTTSDGLYVQKSLPFLSVVQSPKGSYGIRLDGGEWYQTGPMGAFIAPTGKTQEITHHIDPENGFMHAQWVFLDIILNNTYRLDSVYDFPLLFPVERQQELYEILCTLNRRRKESPTNELRCCDDLITLMPLVRILLEIGIPRPAVTPLKEQILSYISAHYTERIVAAELAEHLGISVPGLFRKFQLFFGKSPSEFINNFRLAQASVLLETASLSIGEVAHRVGFEDPFYFSRLFKGKYGLPPSEYRQRNFR